MQEWQDQRKAELTASRRNVQCAEEDEVLPPQPAAGQDYVPEHEAHELHKFKMRYGRPYVLVLWTGLDAAGDTREQLDNLTNCDSEAAIAAFEFTHPPSGPAESSPIPAPAHEPPDAGGRPGPTASGRLGYVI